MSHQSVTERVRETDASMAKAQRYDSLVRSLDTGFCVIEVLFDEDGAKDYVFVETNGGFERATGLKDPVGRRMRELCPELEPFWFETYGRVAETGQPAQFEREARPMQRWFRVHAFRVGRRQVAVLFEDITLAKKAERRRSFLGELANTLVPLREEDAILRETVTSVAEMLGAARCMFAECRYDQGLVLISAEYARPGMAAMPRELPLFAFGGKAWWDVATAGDFAVEDVTTHPLTEAMAAAYLALGTRAYVAQPFRSDGPWTVGLVVTDDRVREWSFEDQKLVEDVIARVWPMVERARSERALQEARDALEVRVAERTATLQETISELESFSYSISHDLRAPLRAMQTYAAILLEESRRNLTADHKEYLRRIKVAADRMDRLIQDVLIYSRVARSQTPVERIELASFISSVIESYPELRDADAEIEIVHPLPAVCANPAALTQCISNLLGNALKFTAPGVRPEVRVSAREREGRVCVCVHDNGVGIAPELHEKIFGMFYKAEAGSAGTGIGLAVVRKAAERMGGTAGVNSAPGQGSTFWIELPAASGRDP